MSNNILKFNVCTWEKKDILFNNSEKSYFYHYLTFKIICAYGAGGRELRSEDNFGGVSSLIPLSSPMIELEWPGLLLKLVF